MDGSFAMLLGDYDPTTPFSLLMELVLPPWQIGRYRLAQVLLAWDDPDEGGGRQNQRQEIVIEVSEEAESPPDTRVIDIVDKVGAFKMGTQALEAAQNASRNEDPQEKGAATVRLRQAATRLLDMGESNLADTMLRQAEILEHGGNMDPEAAKKLRYETRRLTQHT
jgi:Ca-activated chloride channel family protein